MDVGPLQWNILITDMDNTQRQLDGQMSDASSQDSNQTSDVDVGLTNEQPADMQLAAAATSSINAMIAPTQAIQLASPAPKAKIKPPSFDRK